MTVPVQSLGWLIVLAACGAAQLGCDDAPPPPEATATPEAEAAAEAVPALVVATVNGAKIYERDVRFWFERNARGQGGNPTPEQSRNMLEAIISQELILQRATELGLDQNRSYQEQIRARETELASFRRTAVRDLFYAHQLREIRTPTDDEVRQFYDANAALIGSTYHIQHILQRSAAEIEAVQERLEAGAAFEEVAAEPFAALPASADSPWDRRDLAWQHVPELWRGTVATLEAGDVSDVIHGPNNRHWIIRLVAREEDPSMTFERTREDLRMMLQRDAAENLRANLDQSLREEAQIDYAND